MNWKAIIGLVAIVAAGFGVNWYVNHSQVPDKPAVPYVKLPVSVQATANLPFMLTAETNGKHVKWYFLDKGIGYVPLPWEVDSRIAYLIAPVGQYRVLAVAAIGGEPSELALCTVIVGQPGPVPPVPPGPGPVPPVPPIPPVPPVPPTDPFVMALQAAYLAETEPDKSASAAFLARMYQSGAAGYFFNSDQKTTADVLAFMVSVIQHPVHGLPAAKLAKVRRAVADELNKDFGKTSAMDDAKKEQLKAAFKKVQTALETLK